MGLQSRKAPLGDAEKSLLPTWGQEAGDISKSRRSRAAVKLSLSTPAVLSLLALTVYLFGFEFPFPSKPDAPIPPFVKEGIEQCKIIERSPPHFKPYDHKRESNDRFVSGTKSVWLRNATLWTGENGGNEVLYGRSILLDNGIIKKVGKDADIQPLVSKGVEEVELHGAWVTPGIVDMHSHLGVDPAPGLRGGDDTNSLKGSIQPWLRSLDGLHVTDAAFNSSIAGGVTTSLVLPGSANAIGGQAFPIKTRWTHENTPESMLVEPAFTSSSKGGWERTHAWRHIKHACGENPSRVYGNTRLDTAYDFRRAYSEGKKLKEEQERWCASPKTQTAPFPSSLEWEVLADVIRGNVKVNIHCYETVDLNDLVRISNEYQFPIAAFHHAHEAYLVPDLLKSAYGDEPPTVAIFATNARYKRESYRGSEFAPKILADAGLNVAMKSDHPVLDSRYLIFEAAQAHHYGLNFSQALGSVTTHSARALGLDHRVGYVREGYDADIVVWDSFPLAIGATPKQTYIDGIPQLLNPHSIEKPAVAQQISPAGKYDEEAREAVTSRGEPDLRAKKSAKNVVFQDVSALYLPDHKTALNDGSINGTVGTVVIRDGEIACAGVCEIAEGLDFEMVDLKGGSITPGLISVGSYMGLMDIRQEKSTWEGVAYDPLAGASDLIDGLLVHGVDGAEFGSRDELLAYKSGVTTAVAFPISSSFFSGLSYSFSTSATHPLAEGAILNPSAALHLALTNSKQSISTKLAVLRRLLREGKDEDGELSQEVLRVRRGERRLVVEVDKADVIAAVIRLKRDYAPGARITILGGTEAWLVADDLATEDIGVVLAPARSFPSDWDHRRPILGPPLTAQTPAAYLHSKGVKVGLGVREEWESRNIKNEVAWVFAQGGFTKDEALALVGKNLEELLGLEDRAEVGAVQADNEQAKKGWVAWEGDVWSMQARVRGVAAPQSDRVDLF